MKMAYVSIFLQRLSQGSAHHRIFGLTIFWLDLGLCIEHSDGVAASKLERIYQEEWMGHPKYKKKHWLKEE